MARIVYISNGQISLLNASFEWSRRLVSAGHEVSYLSMADVGDYVRAQGYGFAQLSRARKLVESGKADRSPPRWNVLGTLAWLKRRLNLRKATIENREIEEQLGQLRPDIVLIDIELHVPILVVASMGIPIVLPTVFFSLFRDPDVPPLNTGIAPDESSRVREAIDRSWREVLQESTDLHREQTSWKARLTSMLRPVTERTREPLDLEAVAKSRSLNLDAITTRDHWLRPFIFTEFPIASMNAWDLEFPHEKRDGIHYVGPMILEGRRDPDLSPEDDRRWRDFRTKRSESPDRPLIYCSLGSFWRGDTGVLQLVLDAIAGRPEWDLVIGLGGVVDREELKSIPVNAVVLDWAPQLTLLEMADIAVTHAGTTTICECTFFGVPMVLYPTDFVDHRGNAARVELAGLGAVGDRATDTPDKLASTIDSLLSDEAVKQRMDKMRSSFRAYREANTGVDLVEEVIARSNATRAGGG